MCKLMYIKFYWYNLLRLLCLDCVKNISIEYQQFDFFVDLEFFLDLIYFDMLKLEYYYFVYF